MRQPFTNSRCSVRATSNARGNHSGEFARLAEPHRRGLQLHCYRIVGSFHEAEDLVQETLLRAWRGVDGFEGRASFRNWLYRIATNTCLSALAGRWSAERVLIEIQDIPRDRPWNIDLTMEIASLGVDDDEPLERVVDGTPGPDARCEMREAVQLALLIAIQHLPPRQRAVVLLRDVLGWTAIETARLLDTSVATINSLLQRGRTTLRQRPSTGQTANLRVYNRGRHTLLERYVHAWDRADIDKLVGLLRQDAECRLR